MTHRASLFDRGSQGHHLDAPRLRFRRALLLCGLSAVAPGSAQILRGHAVVGRIALAVWVLVLAIVGVLAWRFRADRAQVIGIATNGDVLTVVQPLVVVGVLIWIALLVDAWRLADVLTLSLPRTFVVTALCVALTGAVGVTSVFGVQLLTVQRDVVATVFSETETAEPLQGKYNVLLMGADSGAGRIGIRPDSLTVVNVDAATGRAVLISLPRNLEDVPFPASSPMRQIYPNGFDCGPECLLNAVYTAAEGRPDLYPNVKEPGLEATIDAVEGVTGLSMSYYIRVNMEGFRSLVDAVGGVKMTVTEPIAKFSTTDWDQSEYIQPGTRRLSGRDALWYARSRVQSDDYDRMGRQKCLMSAMLEQLSPQTVLFNAQEIAASSKALLETDLPAEELGTFADIALKVRETKITTVSLVPPKVDVASPDFPAIRAMIDKAVNPPEPPPTTDAPESPESPSKPEKPRDGDPQSANSTEDLAAAC